MFLQDFGDEILKNFAAALKKVFRSNDIVGRFGGDEFVVMISDLPNEKIFERKKIRERKIFINLVIKFLLVHITK